ncbi:putative K(+)-stimulated pyrophosphate-energized sodium pump [Diplonema papillatum]|nr:putative K(+)-stimulated pyrophosphate-energized sodium pump [Diplonema papillatum]
MEAREPAHLEGATHVGDIDLSRLRSHDPGDREWAEMVCTLRGQAAAAEQEAARAHAAPPGPLLLVAGVGCAAACCGCAALAAAADLAGSFSRDDRFQPSWTALADRHFAAWPYAFRDKNCANATIARDSPHTTVDTGTAELIAGCLYPVPYVSVWLTMAAAFLGFAAVCAHARAVLAQPRGTAATHEAAEAIHAAALACLRRAGLWLAPPVALLAVFLFVAVDGPENGWKPAVSASFALGAGLSAAAGCFGVRMAAEGNCRTAAACHSDRTGGLTKGLTVALQTAACAGVGAASAAAFGLSLSYAVFADTAALGALGFGASAAALVARVAGGILAGAAHAPAASPSNVPECNPGGGVRAKDGHGTGAEPCPSDAAAHGAGDIAGGVGGVCVDLFESHAAAAAAAAALGAAEFGGKGVALPLRVLGIGVVWSVVCTAHVFVERRRDGAVPGLPDLLRGLRKNAAAAAVLTGLSAFFVCAYLFEPEARYLADLGGPLPFEQRQPGWRLFGCVAVGLAAGAAKGFATEFFTNHSDEPARSIGRATEFGPGQVIIQGLGVGMCSTVLPLLLVCVVFLGAYSMAGFYGTAVACVGMLATVGVAASTAAYGPVAGNAGGIAETAGLPAWVKESTDALDALGTATAATGRGFANGSAVLSALSVLLAFSRVANVETADLLHPVVIAGLLLGSLLPFVFGAMTILSVTNAAQAMHGIRRQFAETRTTLTDPYQRPDHTRFVAAGCDASLRGMLIPGVLAIFSPLVVGFLFGSHALVGFLLGAITSGHLLGVVVGNAGGAWGNAKRWVEAGLFERDGVPQKKGGECHKAAVCGDAVGRPLRDATGPALNTLVKLMAQFAFVCAPLFDDGWKYWWIGLVLLAGACGVVTCIKLFGMHDTSESGSSRVGEVVTGTSGVEAEPTHRSSASGDPAGR